MPLAQARAYLNEVVGHLLFLAATYVAGYAADHIHGFAFHVPAGWTAITATGALIAVRKVLSLLSKAIHSGKLEAFAVAEAKRLGAEALKDVEAEVAKGL